jgi:DNA-directed RNA polymerase subunit D
MKVKILKKSKEEMSFVAEEIDHNFANELRRIMDSEILTMAIEFVDFKKNDSALPDELIANRLGQVPLKFDQKAYELNATCDNCKGKGCSRCQVELVLKKKGPGVDYSGDLKIKAKDVQPVFEKIPIVELFDPEDEIQFEAVAQLGNGRMHAKWQAALVGYKYDGSNFTFNVETVSGLNPDEIVLSAAEYLEDKASEFERAIGKLK